MTSILGVLILALDIIAIYSILTGGGSTPKKVLWIALVLLLPLVGMILYFLIGKKS